jgi:MFS family permease
MFRARTGLGGIWVAGTARTPPTPSGQVVTADRRLWQAAAPMGRLRARFSPGLGRDYWKLWTSSAISNVGDGTSQLAYPWLASILTRDPLLVAGLTVAQRLPWLLFSLPAGAIVDRGDRRKLMFWMNALRALLSLAFAVTVLTDTASIWLLYLVTLALGCAEVIYDNSAQTIIPRLVPKDRYERANGNLWGVEMVMQQFVGPPLGGFLIAVGLSVPFFVDAGTFAVSASLIFLIAGAYRVQVDPAAAPVRKSMRREIAEGFGWLWRHELLRVLAISLGIMNMMTTLAFATFVLFAQEILLLSEVAFGILLTASAVGGVLGSIAGPTLTRRLGSGPSLFSCLVAGVVTSAIVGLTSTALVVGAMMVVFMFTAVLWNVITVALRQTIIPDRLLGRVNSVYRFFGWGMMPIGALVGGILVSVVETATTRAWGLRSPWLFAAAVYLVLTVFVAPRLTTERLEAAKAEAEGR